MGSVENAAEIVEVDSDEDTDFSDDGNCFDSGQEDDVEVLEPLGVVKQEIVVEVNEPVVYNNSKYFKKRKIDSLQDQGNPPSKVLLLDGPESQLVKIEVNPHDFTIKQESEAESRSEDARLVTKVELNPDDLKVELNPDEITSELNPLDPTIKEETESENIKVELELDNVEVTVKREAIDGSKQERLLTKFNSIRSWAYTRFGDDIKNGIRNIFGDNVKFRVLTYNILAQSSLEKVNHPFSKRPDHLLTWDFRLQGLMREIGSLNPDIICLQEVEFSDLTTVNQDVAGFLAFKGFSYKGRRRSGSKTDGCAIFYKTERFECDAFELVNFKHEELLSLSGNSVGVICRLRPVQAARRLVVGTVHLHFGRDKDVTRLAQIALFLAELDKMCGSGGDGGGSCILAGDFNLEPYTDVHRLIVKGKLSYGGLPCSGGKYPFELFPPQLGLSGRLRWNKNSWNRDQKGCGSFSHEFGFRSVYQYREERNLYQGFAPPESEVTAYQGCWRALDHIFYSTLPSQWEYNSHDGRVEKHLKLLSKWRLPSGPQMEGLGGLPSALAPSDHLPLAADFLFLTR